MSRKLIFNPLSGQFDAISEVTLAAVGSSPNANGATITSDQALNLEPADASNPGVVTTGSQTFAGSKTFSSTIIGTTSGNLVKSTGDIDQTSFTAANNVASPTDITGFAFANGSVRAFEALVSVYIDGTSDLFSSYKLHGVQKSASWEMSETSVGDATGVLFTITTAGQIQYTSTNVSGYVSSVIKYRAETLAV